MQTFCMQAYRRASALFLRNTSGDNELTVTATVCHDQHWNPKFNESEASAPATENHLDIIRKV